MAIKNPPELKNNKKESEFDFALKIFLSAAALSIFFVFTVLIIKINRLNPSLSFIPHINIRPNAGNISDLKKFSSEQDFKNYLETAAKLNGGYGMSFFGGGRSITDVLPSEQGMMSKNIADKIGGNAPDRISQTNVQVIGLDEPDIVKTDGQEIYFSGAQNYYPLTRNNVGAGISLPEQKMVAPYPYPTPREKTNIIKAFPPADLAIDGMIDKQGDLLLNNNILVVFPSQNYYNNKQEITAYDISNPKSPRKKWTITLDDNTSIVASRLKNGKIYLIAKNNINQNQPCPINPLSINNFSNLKEITTITIPCAEIYHPILPIPSDSTFTAMALDPVSGKIEKNISFVGSSGATVIYVSENAIYATYTYNESIVKFFSDFISENSDFFPITIAEKIKKLNSYDISESSKMMELTAIMEKYQSSLNNDDRLKLENEMQNRLSDYYKAHSRELEKTGIVKIDAANLTITTIGAAPGHLLNNFSMDEYQGNLRVATTIGSRWGIFNGIGTGETVSDVTILDKNLKTIGSVRDLGKTEQIYSARFIEDKGYVVTFRQTDPFYILDLANPKNPVLAGELKIPGYSSYLHPLDATHILGIGQEGSQVKISFFDVSDKNNPVELDKYLLDENWTEVANNYHAFLLDTKHKIFFLPGSKGGYVFSYILTTTSDFICTPEGKCPPRVEQKKYLLTLQKAINQNSVKRAIYLNDYLYIIGDDKITVLNESDWEKVNELDLSK